VDSVRSLKSSMSTIRCCSILLWSTAAAAAFSAWPVPSRAPFGRLTRRYCKLSEELSRHRSFFKEQAESSGNAKAIEILTFLYEQDIQQIQNLKSERDKTLERYEKQIQDLKSDIQDLKSDKNQTLERYEKQIQDLKSDIQDLKSDKNQTLERYEKQIQDLKSDIQDLKSDKNQTLERYERQIEDLKSNRDKFIKALNDQLQEMKLKALSEEAKMRVIVNNRALIEIAIARYDCTVSLTEGVRTFVMGHLLAGPKNTLSEYSRRVCGQLRHFGFAGKEQSVSKELANLMHEISKPLHAMQVSSTIDRGYVVGGDQPHAEALAIMIAKLQETKLVEGLDVLLVDGRGKCRCVLRDGEILAYSGESGDE